MSIEIQEKLDLLNIFLETADFKKLRVESEKQLIEGKSIRFAIYLKDQTLKYEMQVIQVNHTGKSHNRKEYNDLVN